MDTDVYNALEEIDAAFFSGDQFHNVENLDTAKEYIERWQREIKKIEEANYYQD